jgi:hypothetical protein
MINVELEIDDEVKNFNLPTGWDDITVKDFCNIYSHNYENMSQIEQAVTILSTLGNIDAEDIMMLTPEQFKMLSEYVSFINKEEVPKNDVEYIEIDGEQYYLKSDFSQLTLGETISIELIVKETDGNIIKAIDSLLCIFLRKKKDNGKLESFKNEFMNRKDIFKNIRIMDVYHLFTAFSIGNNSL